MYVMSVSCEVRLHQILIGNCSQPLQFSLSYCNCSQPLHSHSSLHFGEMVRHRTQMMSHISQKTQSLRANMGKKKVPEPEKRTSSLKNLAQSLRKSPLSFMNRSPSPDGGRRLSFGGIGQVLVIMHLVNRCSVLIDAFMRHHFTLHISTHCPC